MRNCGSPSISDDFFLHARNLKTLDVSDTKIPTLPDNMFPHAKNLEFLYINNCGIKHLPSDFFHNCLGEIRMKDNKGRRRKFFIIMISDDIEIVDYQ